MVLWKITKNQKSQLEETNWKKHLKKQKKNYAKSDLATSKISYDQTKTCFWLWFNLIESVASSPLDDIRSLAIYKSEDLTTICISQLSAFVNLSGTESIANYLHHFAYQFTKSSDFQGIIKINLRPNED